MKKLLVALIILLNGCAMASNGDWTYIRIGTTNQGLEVRDGKKYVKVDSQQISTEGLVEALKVLGVIR